MLLNLRSLIVALASCSCCSDKLADLSRQYAKMSLLVVVPNDLVLLYLHVNSVKKYWM